MPPVMGYVYHGLTSHSMVMGRNAWIGVVGHLKIMYMTCETDQHRLKRRINHVLLLTSRERYIFHYTGKESVGVGSGLWGGGGGGASDIFPQRRFIGI